MNLARPCAVTYLSIGEASKSDADVGFCDQTDTQAYGDERLDDASTDVMTLDFGTICCRNKLRHQEIFEFSSRIILAEKNCLIPEIRPVDRFLRSELMTLWQSNQNALPRSI